MAPLIELKGIRREFPVGDETLTVKVKRLLGI